MRTMITRTILRRAAQSVLGLACISGALGAHADCFDAAARYQQVNPWILRAIAWTESHNQPLALHRNADGSIDYGIMQINSQHLAVLAQYGVTTKTLLDGCPNVYVAAWYLRHEMDKYGNTWAAVGSYHSETPTLRDQYAHQIMAVLHSWKQM